MTTIELWHFVRAHGVKSGEVVALLLGLAALAFGVWYGHDTSQKPRVRWTYGDVVTPVLGVGVGVVLLLGSRSLVRTRYLAEPGGGRYTVGTVYKHDSQRGIRRFVCAYYVTNQRYQTDQECGIAQGRELPCPLLQARFYIGFAPESPGTAQITNVPVPDSVRSIPPLGWDRIP